MRMPFESEFRISSPYGYRLDPVLGDRYSWHGGVDLVGNDRNVRAVMPGYVIRSRIVTDPTDLTSEWGNYVSVCGEDGNICYYCHLAERAVERPERVKAGDILGIEGATGKATGVHLHFEVRTDAGTQLDPCAYLGIPNRAGYVWKPEPAYLREAHDWSRDAVEWAVQRGILKGRGGDDWALGEYLTREEMCVMLYRAREVL